MRFIKFIKSQEFWQLIQRNHNAFVLLSVIAARASRDTGEAYIGDHRHYSMTERGYRTAKKCLQSDGLATFKATNKGTVAKILDARIYDINMSASDEQDDSDVTDKRRTSDGQVTTNKKKKKNENKEVKKTHTQESAPAEIAVALPAVLDTAEFRAAWAEFKLHREDIRKKMTPRAQRIMLNDLSKHPFVAVKALHESIKNGWQGVFPEKLLPKQTTTAANHAAYQPFGGKK